MLNSLKNLTVIMIGLVVLSAGFAVAQENQDEEIWFTASATLDNARLQSLRQTGYLKIPVPPQYVNRIDGVVLKRPVFFKEEKATEFVDVEKKFNLVQFDVSESFLDQLDYQAIEFRIYESDFNTIVLRYTGGQVSRNAKRSQTGDPKTDSPVVSVILNTGKGISGRIRGVQKIEIKSVIGDLKVALDKASQISVTDDQLTLSMLNGDSISGTSNFEEIELLTRWGTEVIDLEDIQSISMAQPRQLLQPTNQLRQAPPMPRSMPMTNTNRGVYNTPNPDLGAQSVQQQDSAFENQLPWTYQPYSTNPTIPIQQSTEGGNRQQ